MKPGQANRVSCITASTKPVRSVGVGVGIGVTLSFSLCHPPTPDTLPLVKENSAHTIGVEFSSRTMRIGDRNIKLQVGVPTRPCPVAW